MLSKPQVVGLPPATPRQARARVPGAGCRACMSLGRRTEGVWFRSTRPAVKSMGRLDQGIQVEASHIGVRISLQNSLSSKMCEEQYQPYDLSLAVVDEGPYVALLRVVQN